MFSTGIYLLTFVILRIEGAVPFEKEAMTGYILHQSYPKCHDVNMDKELLPCSISATGKGSRMTSIESNLQASHCTPCNGSMNMRCLPVSLLPERYACNCVSDRGEIETAIKWSDAWEEISQPYTAIKLSLCDTQAGWCLDGMFKKHLVHLVNHTVLDSQITVSSVRNLHYLKEKIRIQDLETYCAWIKADNDQSPWVKFDLLRSYRVAGVVIRMRCDFTYGELFVETFHLSTSHDDVIWFYIGTDIEAEYKGITFTFWLDSDVSARYWRIEPINYRKFPAMQADLLGYIT